MQKLKSQKSLFLDSADFYGFQYLGSTDTLKRMKQKLLEIVQVNVSNFFYFDEIRKMKKVGPKNMQVFCVICKIGQNQSV